MDKSRGFNRAGSVGVYGIPRMDEVSGAAEHAIHRIHPRQTRSNIMVRAMSGDRITLGCALKASPQQR